MADTQKKTSPEMKSKIPGAQNLHSAIDSSKTEIKNKKEDKKEGMGADVLMETCKEKVSQKGVSNGKMGKSKDGKKSKDEKAKNDKDGKDESRSNSNKEGKEKRKPEEPPQHPGLILQTKWSRDSKLCSLSLSPDSLLDYTDKDIEESSFELSLFAETLYEMFQHQMSCCLLAFLQRLHIKFLTKRNQRKRQRSEVNVKENDKKSLVKRLKTDEIPVKSKSSTSETPNSAQPDDEKTMVKEGTLEDEAKVNEETADEEDPDKDPEEDEEMEDASSQHNSSNGNDEKEGKTDANAEPDKESGNGKDEVDESTKEKTNKEAQEAKRKSDAEMYETGDRKGETVKKEVIHKELLQAFRFFDRNQVGYIRVEDMRLIIHNLGKFLSHRDVKELAQSTLLESNTGRDDRILYNKLVRMTDI